MLHLSGREREREKRFGEKRLRNWNKALLRGERAVRRAGRSTRAAWRRVGERSGGGDASSLELQLHVKGNGGAGEGGFVLFF